MPVGEHGGGEEEKERSVGHHHAADPDDEKAAGEDEETEDGSERAEMLTGEFGDYAVGGDGGDDAGKAGPKRFAEEDDGGLGEPVD